MVEQLPDTPRDVPRVILAQRVIDKMVAGARLYPEPETGEALIGLVVPQSGRLEPDIYVLDTIGPGQDAVREWGMFEQGDDWQADVFNWLHANWETFRELRRSSYGRALAAKWDTPLRHVGDWHKQPGDMVEPSGGDARTARAMIADPETPIEQLVAPIVTLYPLAVVDAAQTTAVEEVPEDSADAEPATAIPVVPPMQSQSLAVRAEDEGWLVRMDFWYMSRRAKKFAPVTPIVWPDDRLPGLPPVAWHLVHQRRFEQEFNLLKDDGYMVTMEFWDADGKPPYEICFSVYQPGSQHVVLLVTPADYPAQQPSVRLAPLVPLAEGEAMFEKLYEASRPVLMHQMPEWAWDSKRTLVELVRHVHKTMIKQEEEA